MRKLTLPLVFLMTANLSFQASVLAKDKGGEVGNPVSVDTAKIVTIPAPKTNPNNIDYCLQDVKADKIMCAYKAKVNGDTKFIILDSKIAVEKHGIAWVTPIKECLAEEISGHTTCKMNDGKIYDADPIKNVLLEAGTDIKTTEYCQSNDSVFSGDYISCEVKGQKGVISLKFSEASERKLSVKSYSTRRLELKNIRNCELQVDDLVCCDGTDSKGKDRIACDYRLPTDRNKYKIQHLCELITNEYVICKGNKYLREKSSLGALGNVFRSIEATFRSVQKRPECGYLTPESVMCYKEKYVRDSGENSSSRSLTKEKDATASDKNQGSKVLSK